MIEVTLAIAIVALGLVGILSLFPVGFQSIRDSVGDNYVNDASQFFLSYIKLEAKHDIADIDTQWNNTMITLPITKPDAPNPSVDTVDPSTSGWTVTTVPNLYYKVGTYGLYRIYSGTNDFKAAVRIWRTKTNSPFYKNSTWKNDSPAFTDACGLNIEFSWPLEKPYAQRTKRFFYYEIFKPQS